MPASKNKKKSQSDLAKNVILLLSGIVIGILSMLWIYPNKVIKPASTADGMNEINNTYSSGDGRIDDYFAFKVNTPKAYFASTDQMLGSYLTVGGMAPPRLVLSKDHQITVDDNGDFLSKVWSYSPSDCISIWTTGGLNSVEEWLDLPGREVGELSGKETIKAGNRDVELYNLMLKNGNIYVAFMPIKNNFSTSYFFRTCNEDNKEDLINIIKSLRLRVDGGI